MRLDAVDQFIGEGVDLAGNAKRAVAQVPAGAACNLPELRRIKIAILETVEFAVLREGT